MATIRFHNALNKDDLIDIVIVPVEFAEGTIGLLLPPLNFANAGKPVSIAPANGNSHTNGATKKEEAAEAVAGD